MDFLSLSRGGKFEDAKQPKVGRASYPYTGPSGYECMPTVISDAGGPFGRNVEPCAASARRSGRRLRHAGRARRRHPRFDQAEAILARRRRRRRRRRRQSLADPDWFLKMRLGRGGEVRRCEFTNYCEGLDQMHKQVTCKLWDREDLDEPGIAKSRREAAPHGAAVEGQLRVG
jgi:dimethylglycine catabolism A